MLRVLRSAAAVAILAVAASSSLAEHIDDRRGNATSFEREYNNRPMYTHNDINCSSEGAECTLSQLKVYLECSSGVERPIHDQKTWQCLRQTYHDIVGADKSTIGPPSRAFNGFAVPYFVDHSPGRGRGLFAAKDISKGTLIWTASRTAEFEDAQTYRNFLLTIPAELACDVMMWAYISYGSETDGELDVGNADDEEEEEEDEEEEPSLKIMLDIDECSFCNDGGKKSNMGWDAEAASLYPDNSDWRVFAVKDVQEGDDLLCNYEDFFQMDQWAAFGL